jgi:uncharacterized protein YjiS (DUF1127 family)
MCRPETPRVQRVGRIARFGNRPARLLVRWVARVSGWRKRRRDLRLLARLDDRSLRDIGIDRATVERESTVSFWRTR